MQSANLGFVISQARDKRHRSPIARAVRAAIEVGVVVPSVLRTQLTDAGYNVVDDQARLSEYGFASTKVLDRVLVTDSEGTIVAMGAAGDHDEALLHAMLGWFRENAVGDEAVPEGLGTAPSAPA
jgi:hypothetical protein